MFSVDAVVWLMEHMEEVNTEMKAIQVNSGARQGSRRAAGCTVNRTAG
jgi:hypothetical protein